MKVYDSIRTNYEEIITFVIEEMQTVWESKGSTTSVDLLELGTGSGIFTGTLLKHLSQKNGLIQEKKLSFHMHPKDLSIICTEPAKDFASLFSRKFPQIPIMQCKAESLPLQDSTVGVVVAATSFHWFDTEKALAEIYRVLVDGGILGLRFIQFVLK